ncbi:hypothetical protein JHK87_018922 [Glycine soja]|nr:hypothetical protein JHK87_018922 [Glycine soja]
MNLVLALEDMDCVMDEVLEVFGKFSIRVHRLLSRIIDIGIMGVINVSECPKIVRIDEKDIHELLRVRDGGVSEKKNLDVIIINDNSAIVLFEGNNCRAITTISEQK